MSSKAPAKAGKAQNKTQSKATSKTAGGGHNHGKVQQADPANKLSAGKIALYELKLTLLGTGGGDKDRTVITKSALNIGTMPLETHPDNHVAWGTRNFSASETNTKVSNYRKKYGNFMGDLLASGNEVEKNVGENETSNPETPESL